MIKAVVGANWGDEGKSGNQMTCLPRKRILS